MGIKICVQILLPMKITAFFAADSLALEALGDDSHNLPSNVNSSWSPSAVTNVTMDFSAKLKP